MREDDECAGSQWLRTERGDEENQEAKPSRTSEKEKEKKRKRERKKEKRRKTKQEEIDTAGVR